MPGCDILCKITPRGAISNILLHNSDMKQCWSERFVCCCAGQFVEPRLRGEQCVLEQGKMLFLVSGSPARSKAWVSYTQLLLWSINSSSPRG